MEIENIISLKIKNEIDSLAATLREELKKEINNFQSPWLSRKDAADYLKVSVSSIDNYVRWGYLEKFKIESNTRFKKSDLDNLLF
jgi:hypothetical protein